MFSLGKVSGAAALLAGLASAQNFRVVGEVYNGTPGDIWSLRTYYADGEVYMGQVIPDEVTTSLNYTSTSTHLHTPPPFLTLLRPSGKA